MLTKQMFMLGFLREKEYLCGWKTVADEKRAVVHIGFGCACGVYIP